MADEIPPEHEANYEQFRDILSSFLIEHLTPISKPTPKAKRRSKKTTASPPPTSTTTTTPTPTDDDAALTASDLADFTTYIATSTFLALPTHLQSLNHFIWADTPSLQTLYTPLPLSSARTAPLLQTLDPTIPDSLTTYGITSPTPTLSGLSIPEFFAPILSAYITTLTTPPPPPSSTRGKVDACEICARDWINLSYHHLIPRFVHAKVVKRGWHRVEELQNVAWLCGACHRFVHRFAGHEELAREYYTVERLMEQEEVRRWAEWVGRVRWKAK